VVRLEGELTSDAPSTAVEGALKEHYVNDGVRRIRIDLRDIDAIDLEGVAVLVRLFRESERRGKALTVDRAWGAVREKLHTTGILRIMGPSGPA
jgi:anti-anti-sigma factor